MDETFDSRLEFDEGPEICDARDGAGNPLADRVALGRGLPGLRLELFQAERDSPVGRVDLQHLDLELLANGEHVLWIGDAAPRDVTDVQQAVDSAEIDEGAVGGEAAHRAADNVAFPDRGKLTFLGGEGLLLENGAAVDHYILVGDVELGDAAGDLLPHQVLHLAGFADSAARGGHKGAHADIDTEATLNQCGHGADDCGLLREGLLQRRPVLDGCQALERELVIALHIAALDRNGELVAPRYGVGIVREGRPQQNAFGLVADVKVHRIGGHRDDSPLQLLWAVFRLVEVAPLKLRKQVGKRLCRFLCGFGGNVDGGWSC